MMHTILLAAACSLWAQAPNRPLLGTVIGFAPERLQLQVQPDAADDPVAVSFDPATTWQRVAPGQTNLAAATAIAATDLAIGDRVLVTFAPSAPLARRVIVMAASDIASRQRSDRDDWNRRGVMGIVAGLQGQTVTLRVRAPFAPETETQVLVSLKTKIRRYSPGSIKFSDAVPAALTDLRPGDQLRARGNRTAEGRIEAEEIVFGTFLSSAGKITAIDPVAGTVTLAPLAGSGKPLLVRVRPDSQVKRMPDFPGGGPMAGGPPLGGPSGPGGPGGPGGPPDPSRMIERLPSVSLDTLKTGETVVVSSTRGASDREVTAIVLLANAELLLRLAAMQTAGAGRPPIGGQAAGIGGPPMGGDLSAILPAMLQ